MSACSEVRVEIQTYVDGELDCDRALVIAVHLDRCAECDREAAAFATLKRALRRQAVSDAAAIARLRAFAALLSGGCSDPR
jgi:anti-sigma factor RsiW